jgi:hypothetical protein
MALIRYGPIAAAISGRLGGAVFYAGKRSGVIAAPPSTHGTPTIKTLQIQRALQRPISKWIAAPEDVKTAWRAWARAHPGTNPLGQKRYPSGYQRYVQFSMLVDPEQKYGFDYYDVMAGGFFPQPHPTAVDYQANDHCIITADNYIGFPMFEQCWINYPEQYGPRHATGTSTYGGALVRSGPELDWFAEFTARGITLEADDQFTISLYWRFANYFPSAPVKISGTVTA